MPAGGNLVFSYEEFAQLVHRFAETVPQLLLRHPATVPLAFQLEQLQLTEALRIRFTVAVMGQMRVGKSTLLNALLRSA
jgi:tRNA U34 5-carboxymethylaminomethyl modifying GTPase MnmE/TrmE